jgi:hypothetical protein
MAGELPSRARIGAGAGPGRGAAGLVLGVAVLGLVAGPVRAQESPPAPIAIEITVLEVSDRPPSGPKDPGCDRFDRLLRGQIAYQSLSVVDRYQRDVPLNDVWTVELPTQRSLHVRPVDRDRGKGTLLSLDVEDAVQGDFRVRRGQPLVVGGPRYGDGKLVVVVDTE